MANVPKIVSAMVTIVAVGLLSASGMAADLSTYREFRFGMDLNAVAKQIGASESKATLVHRRPALIHELEWDPQPLGWSDKEESVQRVLFSFYDGKLFRITVQYSRSETEGLTAEDLVKAISSRYGPAQAKPNAPVLVEGPYGEKGDLMATWEDNLYRFQLVRLSYGPTYKLVGIVKDLDTSAKAAVLEAVRLDEQEAPAREAARVAGHEAEAKSKLDKARLVNKPKFRP